MKPTTFMITRARLCRVAPVVFVIISTTRTTGPRSRRTLNRVPFSVTFSFPRPERCYSLAVRLACIVFAIKITTGRPIFVSARRSWDARVVFPDGHRRPRRREEFFFYFPLRTAYRKTGSNWTFAHYRSSPLRRPAKTSESLCAI